MDRFLDLKTAPRREMVSLQDPNPDRSCPWAADFQLPGVLHVPGTSELNSAAMPAMQLLLCKSFARLSQGNSHTWLCCALLDEAMRTIFYLDTLVDLRRSNLYKMAFHTD